MEDKEFSCKMARDFFVVDFEFTKYTKPVGRPRGFFAEIIEIGAVKISGETLEVVGEFGSFVRPHFFPKQAGEGMEFSMISEKHMQSAIEFKEMLAQICGLYVPHKTYFVAWGDADYRVLDEGCKRHKLENPVLFEDYLDMAAWYRWEMGDSYTTGLRRATEEQGIDSELFWHTAVQDAANTGTLLVKLIRDGWNAEDFLLRDRQV